MNQIFNKFSIILYALMLIIHLFNFQHFLIYQMVVISAFLLFHIIKNKFTWYGLLILTLIMFIAYFFRCDNIYPNDLWLINKICYYRPFDLWNYLPRFINLNISTTYYNLFYFIYLFVTLIVINLRNYRKLYQFPFHEQNETKVERKHDED